MASNGNWGGGNVSVPTPYPTTPQDAVKQFLRMGGDPTATVMMLNVDFASKFPGINTQLIKSGLGTFFFPTKKAFSDAVSELDMKEAKAIAASVNIPAAAVDAPVSTLSPVRTGGTGGGTGGGNGFSGYRIVASSPSIENVATGEELPVAPEEEPEMTTAIIPYTPTITPADAAEAIMRDPARFVNRTDMSKAAIAIMFMAVVIKSLKKGAIGAATGSWYLISSLISYLGEEIQDRDTLLAAMRSGAITHYDQLAYSHDLLTKISKQIISKTRSAGPALIAAAAEAYSAGQEALLTAYNMFGALATVRRLYPDIKATLAPGLQIKRAGLDSAECNLLKAYVLFVNAIINKYEKRRIFANEWLSLDERLRRDIIRDSDSKSFIASLFSKIGLFRGRSEPELNMNADGASQTEIFGAQNVGHTGSSGVIKALITENEMRMVNALVASILSDNTARCTPANLKAEMRDILEMKEADVPNIRSVERFRTLHNTIVRERTQGTSGGGAAAAAFGGPILGAEAVKRLTEQVYGGEQGGPRTNFGSIFAKPSTNMSAYGKTVGGVAALPFTAATAAGQRIGVAVKGVGSDIGAFGRGVAAGAAPLTAAVGTAAGAIRTAAGGVVPALKELGGSLRPLKKLRLKAPNGGTIVPGFNLSPPSTMAPTSTATSSVPTGKRKADWEANAGEEEEEEEDMIGAGTGISGGGAPMSNQAGGSRKTRRAKHKKTRKARHVIRKARKTRDRKRLTRRR